MPVELVRVRREFLEVVYVARLLTGGGGVRTILDLQERERIRLRIIERSVPGRDLAVAVDPYEPIIGTAELDGAECCVRGAGAGRLALYGEVVDHGGRCDESCERLVGIDDFSLGPDFS